ncbi:MAG TPA: DUF418 domain-containing protein [Allosphingosinicella sp.]|jgi:uncharacterized protein
MHAISNVAPIAADERIILLDALRGFALLGVFVANMHSFSGWFMLGPDGQVALFGATARDVEGLVFGWLIEGKFYTIFSLLFGIGFALQLDRLDRRGDAAAARFRRRMGALLLIGLIHLLAIWFGDILTLYALSGFLLLAVRGWTDSALLRLATVLILLPVPAAFLVHLTGWPADLGLYGVSERVAAATGHSTANMVAWMRAPEWKSFADWQASFVFYRIGSLIAQWRLAKVFGIMAIGLWAGRRLIDGTLFTDRARLRRVMLWGLAIGLPANLLTALMGGVEGPYGWPLVLSEIGYALGVVPLGLAYGAAFALAWPRRSRVLGIFTPVGRMALTNYLAQSVIGVAIFHGIGLGLGGTLSPAFLLPLTLAIFAGQILLSRLWLARFGQGPMERLWRWMTYGASASSPRFSQ